MVLISECFFRGQDMTSAIIVAAGKGTRMKSAAGVSKQYIEIMGKPERMRKHAFAS